MKVLAKPLKKKKLIVLNKKVAKKKVVKFVPNSDVVKLDLEYLTALKKKGVLGQERVVGDGYFYINGMNTGCGLYQLSGNTWLDDLSQNEFERVKADFAKFKDTYGGAILCTLGKTYFDNEDRLLKLGFKQIAEYINPGHGEGYTQRLYIYITEKGRYEGN